MHISDRYSWKSEKRNKKIRGKPMKRNKYLTTIRSLAQELDNFKKLIATVSNSQGFLSSIDKQSVNDGIQKILHLIDEAKKFKCLTLVEKDYLNFCFLLVHGSDMADQLLKLQGNFEVPIKHALSWKKIAKHFKTFLRGNLRNKNIMND
jgi:ERCC4 domain